MGQRQQAERVRAQLASVKNQLVFISGAEDLAEEKADIIGRITSARNQDMREVLDDDQPILTAKFILLYARLLHYSRPLAEWFATMDTTKQHVAGINPILYP